MWRVRWTAVHVTADRHAIPDVLSGFKTPFNLRYHSSVPLDGNVSSVYSGSLTHVISRLWLRLRDRPVITHPFPAPNDQEVASLERIVRAARIAAKELRPLRRPVPTIEQRSA
jgi:hypothetical protein